MERGRTSEPTVNGRRRKRPKPARASKKPVLHSDVSARAGKPPSGAVSSFMKGLLPINSKTTEEQLAFYTGILDNTYDAVIARDENDIVTYWNKSAERLLGWAAREIVGRPIGVSSRNVFRARLDGTSWQAAKEQMLKDNSFEGEAWCAKKDGTDILIEIRLKVIRGADGEFKGTVGVVRDITERREMEEALRESEAELAESQRETKTGSWSHEIMTGKVYWSKELYRIFELDESEFGGLYKSFLGRVHPDDRERVMRTSQDARNFGTPFTIEYRVITSAGEKIIRETGYSTKDVSGHITRLFGTAQDVTAIRKAEESLRESEGRFRSVLEHSRDIVYRLNIQTGIFEYVSPSCEMVTGYTVEELTAMGLAGMTSMIHPGDIAAMQTVVSRLEETGEDEVEYRLRVKDGSYRWLVNHISLIRDDAGRPLYQVGNIHDVTERKKMEMQLRESGEMFRKLSESSPVAVLMYRGNKLLYANPAATRIFTYTKEELLSMDLTDLMHADYRKDVQERVRKRMAGDKIPAHYEIKAITKTGKEKWLDVSSNLIAYKGAPAGIVICMDITEKKYAEEVLRHDKETLERVVRERTQELLKTHTALDRSKRMADIGRLSATVAHELRNPLAAIKTAAFNLERKAKDPSLGKHIDNINKKVLEGDQIIRNLLSFSRIKSVALEKLNIRDLLKDCIAAISEKYTGWDVVLKEQIECGKRDLIEADGTQLKMLFSNILDNAYQALHSKKGAITITAQKDNNEAWKISISDTGIGMDEHETGKIFDPFYTRKAKGTGLGLTVSKEIAELHGGKIEVKSTKGAGTIFTVTLPISNRSLHRTFQPSARP